jgi:integrase
VKWPEEELVFTSTIGTVWGFRNFLRDYRAVLAATNIPNTDSVDWHTLRHTAASQWIPAGTSVFAVARRLGHSSTSTTERVYAHLLPRQDEIAAHALDHLIAT